MELYVCNAIWYTYKCKINTEYAPKRHDISRKQAVRNDVDVKVDFPYMILLMFYNNCKWDGISSIPKGKVHDVVANQ